MKKNVTLYIGARIVILFMIAMFMTFIPELLRGFFGDIPCNNSRGCGEVDQAWIWGKRHYWYQWMMDLLFLLGLADSVVAVIRVLNKNYKF